MIDALVLESQTHSLMNREVLYTRRTAACGGSLAARRARMTESGADQLSMQ